MIALIQRVHKASVTVDDKTVGSIDQGLCIFLGIKRDDSDIDISYIIKRIKNLRIFEDKDKFELSLNAIQGQILVIPQFTLYGSLKKGNRPSFSQAMKPLEAKELFSKFVIALKQTNINFATGVFGKYMTVNVENNGPASFILSSDHLK